MATDRRAFFHPEAEREFEESASWYDERSPGLGIEFVASVRAKVEQILESPELWPVVKGARRVLVSRFPFAIVYRVLADAGIEILAIAHLRRRPMYWAKR